jgi:hypothetical protein
VTFIFDASSVVILLYWRVQVSELELSSTWRLRLLQKYFSSLRILLTLGSKLDFRVSLGELCLGELCTNSLLELSACPCARPASWRETEARFCVRPAFLTPTLKTPLFWDQRDESGRLIVPLYIFAIEQLQYWVVGYTFSQ